MVTYLHSARADQVVASDPSVGFGISANPAPCFSSDGTWGCSLGPVFQKYQASSSFTLTRIDVSWANHGGNNCDGMGNVIAIITSGPSEDTLVATSTGSIYMGCAGFGGNGTQGTGEYVFPNGAILPQTFYLSFTSPDGMQAGSGVGVNNIFIYGIPAVTAKEPVVIVPGIMGSTLDRTTDGEEVWPNAAKMLLSGPDDYLDDLKLTANGLQTTRVVARDIVREELTLPFYGPLIASLEADGYVEGITLFVAPYDWRQSVTASADAISVVLDDAALGSPDGRVNVIAHSMGGLVMKEYLKENPDSFIHKLILAGVPQLGAPKAFKLLEYGDDLGMNVLGFGLGQDEVQAIAQNMPGVYDLLPSRRYIAVNGGYVEDLRNGASTVLDYDATNALTSNAALVAQAGAWHDAQDNAQFALDPSSVYNILGCGKDTLGMIRIYDDGAFALDPVKGDGTVPLTSAFDLAEGYQNFFDLGDDHTGLVQASAPLSLMNDILDDVTNAAIPGISQSLGDCFVPDEFTISIHGPAELNIYDDAGHHTGPDDTNGTIDLGISSSSYDVIGDNTFITVPADGAPYHVKAVATATGTLALTSEVLEDAAVKKKTTYSKIPLMKTKATASLDVITTSTASALSVDTDADGVFDLSVAPNTAAGDPTVFQDSTAPPPFSICGKHL